MTFYLTDNELLGRTRKEDGIGHKLEGYYLLRLEGCELQVEMSLSKSLMVVLVQAAQAEKVNACKETPGRYETFGKAICTSCLLQSARQRRLGQPTGNGLSHPQNAPKKKVIKYSSSLEVWNTGTRPDVV